MVEDVSSIREVQDLSGLAEWQKIKFLREDKMVLAQSWRMLDELQQTIFQLCVLDQPPKKLKQVAEQVQLSADGVRQRVGGIQCIVFGQMVTDEYVRRVQAEEVTDLSTLPLSVLQLKKSANTVLADLGAGDIAGVTRLTRSQLRSRLTQPTIEKVVAGLAILGATLAGETEITPAEIADGSVAQRPVGDLQLSARALKVAERLGIVTIGGFASVTEQQILDQKNSGEDTLQEIGDKLQTVNMQLADSVSPEPVLTGEQLLDEPIARLRLSTGPRNVLRRLELNTIRALVACTADYLLEQRNFGETALVEVRDKLQAAGLKLRGD